MAMTYYDLSTALGIYWVHEGQDDVRVGIRDVTMALNRGPDSEYEWSLDQEQALARAAHDVGATIDLLVPGGWRITPGSAMPALRVRLPAVAGEWVRTGRTIRR